MVDILSARRFIFHDGWCYDGSTPETKNLFFFSIMEFYGIEIIEKSV